MKLDFELFHDASLRLIKSLSIIERDEFLLKLDQKRQVKTEESKDKYSFKPVIDENSRRMTSKVKFIKH